LILAAFRNGNAQASVSCAASDRAAASQVPHRYFEDNIGADQIKSPFLSRPAVGCGDLKSGRKLTESLTLQRFDHMAT